MSWRGRFEALIRELEAHPALILHDSSLGSPASAEDLAAAARALGRELPAGVREVYSELNGVHVAWSHRQPWWSVGGTIRLLDLKSAFETPWATPDYGDKSYFPLEWPTDEYYAGLAADSGELRWVYDTCDEARALGVDLAGYLDAALEARGFDHWQMMFLYSEERATRMGATTDESVGRMQAILPRLFPSFDVALVGNAAACPAADVSQLVDGPEPVAPRDLLRLDVLAPDGTRPSSLQLRQHLVNAHQRVVVERSPSGYFELDMDTYAGGPVTLYRQLDGLHFSGPTTGASEEWIELSLSGLARDQVHEVRLGPARTAPRTAPDPSRETLLIARGSELPTRFTNHLPQDSPLRECLYWLADVDSEIVRRLSAAIPAPRIPGVSRAIRICGALEDEAEALDLTMFFADANIEAGFHAGASEEVEAWLRKQAHRVESLAAALSPASDRS